MTNTWQHHAACRNHPNPNTWHPHKDDHQTQRTAKHVCTHCPVQTQCLNHALTHGEWHGIWGGYTPHERDIIRAANNLPKTRAPTPIPHGTEAGHRAHRRRHPNQPVTCQPCIQAHNHARRSRRTKGTQ